MERFRTRKKFLAFLEAQIEEFGIDSLEGSHLLLEAEAFVHGEDGDGGAALLEVHRKFRCLLCLEHKRSMRNFHKNRPRRRRSGSFIEGFAVTPSGPVSQFSIALDVLFESKGAAKLTSAFDTVAELRGVEPHVARDAYYKYVLSRG